MRKYLTAAERDRVRLRFTQADIKRDSEILTTLARQFGVTIETVSRSLPFELWRTHDRFCLACERMFEERQPPEVDPRLVRCPECVAAAFPMVRVIDCPLPKQLRGGRDAFRVPCVRGCGRVIRGYLTKGEKVLGVCAECVAADHHDETLRVWRASR